MNIWEYKTIQIKTHGALGGLVDTDNLDSKLNELGKLGWELVSSSTTTQDFGSSRRIIAIFKRPLKEI